MYRTIIKYNENLKNNLTKNKNRNLYYLSKKINEN